jgi:putative ABC transport system permease protein
MEKSFWFFKNCSGFSIISYRFEMELIMKKTFIKNIKRSITKSISRFMAILAIVALGVGFLAGLLATTPDMRLSADKYYDDTNTMDIRIVSTLGLTNNDLESIRSIDSVLNVMPSYSVDVLLTGTDHDSIVTKIHSLPLDKSSYQNKIILIDGRMPENSGECVVEQNNFLGSPIAIGDNLLVSDENIDIEDKLAINQIKIVGVVQSAQYFSVERERSTVGNGTVSLIIYAPEKSFSYDMYTEIYATVKGAMDLNTFSSKYDDLIDGTIDEIESISEAQIALRYNEIIDKANAELADAKKEYYDKKAETKKELQDALNEIENGKKEITDAEIKISDGYKKLSDGQREIEKQKLDFEAQITEKQKEIAEAKKQIADGKLDLDLFKNSLDEAAPKIEEIRPLAQFNSQIAEEVAKYDYNVEQYNLSIEEINKREQELTSGEVLLNKNINEANKKFSLAEQELNNSKIELDNAQEELDAAILDLEDGIKEYDDGKKEADDKFADAQKEIDDAEYDIKNIEQPKWYILDRHSNLTYESFASNAQKIEGIAKVFPILFFLVAALVALTTMTRMVEEERSQIGTMKALGYSKSTIAFKYMLYAALASVVGSIIGLLVGFKLFPTVIWNAYKSMYILPPLITPFNIKYALISSLAAIICTLGATYWACYSSLMESAASLMQPRAPKAGKRVFLEYISPIWKRLKFTHKVTARNLIRYKKRFFMTVIGIAGCTALLVTGFGLRDSIGDIIYKQFNDIFKYNLIVNMKNENSLEKSENLYNIVSDKDVLSKFTTIHQENAKASGEKNNNEIDITITSIENENDLKEFIILQNRKNKKLIEFKEDTVVITEKLAERLELDLGDIITIENSDNKTATFTIAGIAENYLTGYVYIPSKMYENSFGKKPAYNILIGNITNSNESSRDELAIRLLKDTEINAVSFTDVIKDQFSDLLSKIDYIVIVLIVSAGLLAFIVLYNLTNINITERQKEIATIKVLGFHDKEVSAYVYRETIILSLIGTLTGLVLGIFLHAFVIKVAEIDAIMFGREIYPLSYIFSIILTMSFSILVNLVMYKKLRKIDMVESMKANE